MDFKENGNVIARGENISDVLSELESSKYRLRWFDKDSWEDELNSLFQNTCLSNVDNPSRTKEVRQFLTNDCGGAPEKLEIAETLLIVGEGGQATYIVVKGSPPDKTNLIDLFTQAYPNNTYSF